MLCHKPFGFLAVECFSYFQDIVHKFICRKLKNVFGIYIFSLAWADWAVGLIIMGGMTTYSIPNYWPIGFDMCSLWIVIDYPCCTVSMLHLCVIARDRYLALSRPLDYKNLATTKNAILYSIASWIGGFALWVPTIMYIREYERDILDPFACYFTSTRPNIIMAQAAIVYYTPIFVMCYYYFMCVHLLRKRMSITAALGAYEKNNTVSVNAEASGSVTYGTTQSTQTSQIQTISDGNTNYSAQKYLSPSAQEKENDHGNKAEHKSGLNRQEQQLRGIRTLGVVIFMFLFCWVPFCAFWPIVAYCPEGCIPLRLYVYSYWMPYVNSTINPLLYFLVNKDFRVAFYRLLRTKRM